MPEVSYQNAEDEGSERIDFDLPCLRCGYNLRTLRVSGVCPECGEPVSLTTDLGATKDRRIALREIAYSAWLLSWLLPSLTLLTIALGFAVPGVLCILYPAWIVVFFAVQLGLLGELRMFVPKSRFRSSLVAAVLGALAAAVLLDIFGGATLVGAAAVGAVFVVCVLFLQLSVLQSVRRFAGIVGARKTERAAQVLSVSFLLGIGSGSLTITMIARQPVGSPTVAVAGIITVALLFWTCLLYFLVMAGLSRRLRTYRSAPAEVGAQSVRSDSA